VIRNVQAIKTRELPKHMKALKALESMQAIRNRRRTQEFLGEEGSMPGRRGRWREKEYAGNQETATEGNLSREHALGRARPVCEGAGGRGGGLRCDGRRANLGIEHALGDLLGGAEGAERVDLDRVYLPITTSDT